MYDFVTVYDDRDVIVGPKRQKFKKKQVKIDDFATLYDDRDVIVLAQLEKYH